MKQTSKKFPLTLSTLSNTRNNKITASQQSVLTPHRGQESILNCISSSPSHQHLNGCAVNPLGSRKKKKRQQISFVLTSPSFLTARGSKNPNPSFHPEGPASVTQPQHYSRYFVTKSCPATCPLCSFISLATTSVDLA